MRRRQPRSDVGRPVGAVPPGAESTARFRGSAARTSAPHLRSAQPSSSHVTAPPHRLPAQPTALIGRESDLARAAAQLARADVRLLTLTGAGGSGKTRLAIELAARSFADFEAGVYFVDLTAIRDPALALPAVAQTLGVRDTGAQPLLERVQRFMGNQRMLMLLDNCEHVLDGVDVVTRLLETCRAIKVLATSREPLHLRWEHELPVAPLALPDLQNRSSEEDLGRVPSVALFVERATAIDVDFALTDANRKAVAEICVRLDGLPLAIELAAANVRVLPLDSIRSRLAHGLDLPSIQARDVPARQRTLRSAIDWSYALLTAPEQAMF